MPQVELCLSVRMNPRDEKGEYEDLFLMGNQGTSSVGHTMSVTINYQHPGKYSTGSPGCLPDHTRKAQIVIVAS